MKNKKLSILGIRGIPAQHGGFETFAEKIAFFLIANGWDVTVYCQEQGNSAITESVWQGVRRIHIPVTYSGSIGTVVFDWKAIQHALSEDGMFLTLGYNTAIFNLLQRFSRQVNLINMDGIEWHRNKWGFFARVWFWLNERAGCLIGNHLIADHPQIKRHLSRHTSKEKITMIPYGGDEIVYADQDLLVPHGLMPGGFSVIIARPEPENSFLEMVRAFSRTHRNHKLVVLGNFQPAKNLYHSQVIEAAGPEVIFLGAIYDANVVQALRFFSRFYLHGHRVGGTNPSLVEALGAGCAVIAHDNHFNRWVAGPDAAYFKDESSCEAILDQLLKNEIVIEKMRVASKARFLECFTWPIVLHQYKELLEFWYSKK